MNGHQPNDFYGEAPPQRSPRQRFHTQPPLHHQGSRGFDNFAPQPDPMFDDFAPPFDAARYNNNRLSSPFANNMNSIESGMPPQPQAWNPPNFGHNNQMAALGATGSRMRPQARTGRHLPNSWMEQAQPPHPSHFNGFHGPGTGYPPLRPDQLNAEGDDELIPTAIVIKNIPFAVKKETLVHVMQDLQVPLPYAFNYHFDNGVFRGLAFANFTTPEETSAVIHAMNHMELHGRKLRVEYKKMLPQAERDRIEREKRERRGQLEEQHRPMAAGGLQNQPSLSSLGSHVPATSPSPLSGGPGQAQVDFNDPAVLGYYRALAVFAEKGETDYITFPAEIPAEHRRVIHKLAHDQGLGHESLGQGPDRRIHIYRHPAGTYGISPTVAGNPYAANTGQRSLNRAATTDFTNVRSNEAGFYEAPTPSVSGWSASADPQSVLSASANLRNAKSFADLRSNAGSPAHSNPGSGLLPNMSRFQSYGSDSPNSSRTNLATTSAAFSNGPDSLLNGISSMSLNSTGYGPTAGSPQRLRGIQPWDREPTGGPGPIGGHRTQSGNHEEQSRNRGHGIPTRPLRGALSGGSAFPRRQNGHQKRGSDEISSPSGVEINITQ